jgi:hypothetical protein
MKRILFPSLVLCAALASGCKTEPNNNNANQAGNQNSANVNQPLGNLNSGALTRDPKNKAVMITVSDDGSGRKISVAPDAIYLWKSKGQKLRFYVFDDLDKDLSSVTIVFKASDGDPMDGPYTFGTVASGTDERSTSHGVKSDATAGPHHYTITVKVDGETTPITLDPEIEVGN